MTDSPTTPNDDTAAGRAPLEPTPQHPHDIPRPANTHGPLGPRHLEQLTRRGVSQEVARARRYSTADTKAGIEKLGFSRSQASAPALVIPLYDASGRRAGVQIRPDTPRCNAEGKPIKYESPRNSTPIIDVPPAVREKVLDPLQPLVITEGTLKADAAASKGIPCVSVAGVYSWRTDDTFWTLVPLHDRTVLIAFDSDQATNPNVRTAAARLHNEFRRRGAKPKVVSIPGGAGGAKRGLDDYLLDHSADDLFRLPHLDADEVGEPDPVSTDAHYRTTPHGLVRLVIKGDEVTFVPLANFNARITADIEIDNGSDIRRELEIAVESNGSRQVIQVPAEEFERMNWVLAQLGGNAIVSAGIPTRDHARAAIQSVSGAIPRRKVYEHLGWLKVSGRWVFLHAGGAIGTASPDAPRASGNAPGIGNLSETQEETRKSPIGPMPDTASEPCGVGVRIPPALKGYRLPDPLSGDELKEAIHDTLYLLSEIAPPHLYLILLAATFRVSIDRVDFSIHLVGRTNVGKTVLLGLFAQFFGPDLHDRNLPGSWLSTSNSLLGLMALAKNVTLPIDDFVPAGSQADIERANRMADQVFRAQGNQAGRGRCTRDGTPKEGRSPQCLPISTGEDVPEGHSLNSRLLALEVKAGDVLSPARLKALSLAQKSARRGLFAGVMASFLAWLAPRYEDERESLHEQKEEFRDVFREDGRLARSVDIAADLLAGFETFLDFCSQAGAITEEKRDALWGQIHDALDLVLVEQKQTAEEADPVCRYLELLVTAFTTGRAHLRDRSNQVPPAEGPYPPDVWGWRKSYRSVQKADEDGEPNTEGVEYYIPQGPQVGWVSGGECLLEIEASLAVVQELARDSSLRPLPLTKRTLGKTLQARGLLSSTTGEGHYTDRVSVVGIQRRVLRVPIAKIVALAGRADERTASLDDLLDA